MDAAKEAVLLENLRTTRDVIGKFYGDTGRFPDSLKELVERKYLASLPIDPLTEATDTWVVVPVPEGYKGFVYDIRSSAPGLSVSGSSFSDW